jgi:hypothetical protein
LNTVVFGSFRSRIASRARDAIVVLLAVGAGFAIALVPRAFNNTGDDGVASPRSANPRVQLSKLSDARVAKPLPQAMTNPADVEPPAAPAPTPAAAVTEFLDAETAGDYASSYGRLSAPDRLRTGSRSEWTNLHAQLPTIRGFTLGETRSTPAGADIDADVQLKPGLDTIVGLVPARARAAWIAVAEDGGWRVDFDNSTLVPEYPPDAAAVDDATSWVSAQTQCRRAPQIRDGLLGAPALAGDLCGAHGPVRVGTAAPLQAGTGVEPFVAAFGPDVFTWARAIPVASPAPMSVVLAPIGDRWVVIGVLESLPGDSS